MLARLIADTLKGTGPITALVTGGIYPDDTHEATQLTRQSHPEAFDAAGRVKPTILVQEDGTLPNGSTRKSGHAFARILLWQQAGRGEIAEALRLANLALDDLALSGGGWRFVSLTNVGDGPQLPDPGLQDAEHQWSRWQAAYLREG